MNRLAFILWLFTLNTLPQPTKSQTAIEDKAQESLRKLFGDSVSIEHRTIRLSKDEKKIITHETKTFWQSDSIRVFICRLRSEAVGYGVIDNVKGKTQSITYLVSLIPAGEVKDVDVLAYRESYGGEIQYESFRKQFRKKTRSDKLQPGKDIKNISGATISVHAISDGVRKILASYNLIRDRLQ